MPRCADSELVRDLVSASVFSAATNVVQHLLRVVRTHLGLDVAFVSRLDGDVMTVYDVDAPGQDGIFGEPGKRTPASQTYCGLVRDGKLPELINDTGLYPLACALPATDALGIRANLTVPIYLSDGALFGMFCGFATSPDPTLNRRDINMMRAFAQIAAVAIEGELATEREAQRKRDRLAPLLADRAGLDIVLQPIWDLEAATPFGAEALSRFAIEPRRTPDVWFREADEVGLGSDLEITAIRAAIDALSHLPPDTSLFVNSSPATVTAPEFAAALHGVPLNRLVIEITEHSSVAQYEPLERALLPLRRDGLRIAVDDAGGGYSSFKHIIRLRPDIIKADTSIVRNVHNCPSRRAMIQAIGLFAQETDTLFLGEGAETADELRALIELGVDLAQGYFLGRPTAPVHLGEPLAAAVPALAHAKIAAQAARASRRMGATAAIRVAAA